MKKPRHFLKELRRRFDSLNLKLRNRLPSGAGGDCRRVWRCFTRKGFEPLERPALNPHPHRRPHWRLVITVLLLGFRSVASFANPHDLVHAPLNLERAGTVYDELVPIPKSPRLILDSWRGLNFNLKVRISNTRPERHDAQYERMIREWRLGNEDLASVDLFLVNGFPDYSAKEIRVTDSAELLRHSFPFRLRGMPIRLKVIITPQKQDVVLTYIPGQWVYVPAHPRSLVMKQAHIIDEEINLAKCHSETEGTYSRNKYLIQLRAVEPGSAYRIQVINLDATPLPEGIAATLRMTRPDIAK